MANTIKQMTLFELYPMPCSFRIGDRIHNHRFEQDGVVIRVYGQFCDYQLDGTKGIDGVRYTTEQDSYITGRIDNEEQIRDLEEKARIFFKRIRSDKREFNL